MGIDITDMLKVSVRSDEVANKNTSHVTFNGPIIMNRQDDVTYDKKGIIDKIINVYSNNRNDKKCTNVDRVNANNNNNNHSENNKKNVNVGQVTQNDDVTTSDPYLFSLPNCGKSTVWSNDGLLICKQVLGEEEYEQRLATQFDVSA